MQTKIIFLVAAIAVLPQAINATPATTELEPNLVKGDAYLKAGKIDQAINAYRLAEAHLPLDSKIHLRLSRAYELNNDLGLAQLEDLKAIKLDPQNAYAHYHLGKLLSWQSNFRQSAHQEALALQINPKYTQAYLTLGLDLVYIGDYERAVQADLKAIELDPNNVSAYINLGSTLGRQGKYTQAIKAYKTALALEPNSTLGHLNLGDALGKTGDIQQQIIEYKTAVRLAPQDDSAHGKLSWALYKSGNISEAVSEGFYTNWLRLKQNGPAYLQAFLGWWGILFLFFGLVFSVLFWGSRFSPEKGESIVRTFFLVLYNDKPGRLILTNKRLIFVPEVFSKWFGSQNKPIELSQLEKIETGYVGGNALILTTKDNSTYKFLMPNLVLKPLFQELTK